MAIHVCPLSLASKIAREHKPSHVVSLLDPGTPFPALLGCDERHFKLPVHDIEHELIGFDAICDKRVRSIIAFVSGWERDAPMLVHCYAGISRSTATAYITACAHNPGADEEEIAAALRAASPSASPNRRFVALADAELDRGGRMVRAIERIGRGASWLDVGEAKPFTLSSRFGA
ncbi:MAG: protein tyrosine phosphatase [Hyphomonadaceae bacterium]|nr:protein tyrosine phosphatase [Hyphomonadaceae bacterium]